ncbi:MAG TPA: hypothetical protein PKM35_03275 [Holophaga sp.]|nr:hypothetical protein [Holophaga sp.]HPS67485.1 hypothetical protein [Holophaga sp.]
MSPLRRMSRAGLGVLAVGALSAAPSWRTPATLPFGELSVLELREEDAAQPALPRPGDGKLGPLLLRGVEPSPDGRGWRLTVQPMVPGTALVPPVDLGDGRRTPELRIPVPRTVPYQAPWMGVGGGPGDVTPRIPFPWAWASLLLLPPTALLAWLWRRWRRSAPARARHRARSEFSRCWPPGAPDRATLDASHAMGRNLLAVHFGEESRSWGVRELEARRLAPWAAWVRSLDAARFSRLQLPFPALEELLACLEERR